MGSWRSREVVEDSVFLLRWIPTACRGRRQGVGLERESDRGRKGERGAVRASWVLGNFRVMLTGG